MTMAAPLSALQMKATDACKIQVFIRGIERRKIFKDNEDRENLISRLDDLLPKTKTTCYAWEINGDTSMFLCFSTMGIYEINFNIRQKYSPLRSRSSQSIQNKQKVIFSLWRFLFGRLQILVHSCCHRKAKTGQGLRSEIMGTSMFLCFPFGRPYDINPVCHEKQE